MYCIQQYYILQVFGPVILSQTLCFKVKLFCYRIVILPYVFFNGITSTLDILIIISSTTLILEAPGAIVGKIGSNLAEINCACIDGDNNNRTVISNDVSVEGVDDMKYNFLQVIYFVVQARHVISSIVAVSSMLKAFFDTIWQLELNVGVELSIDVIYCNTQATCIYCIALYMVLIFFPFCVCFEFVCVVVWVRNKKALTILWKVNFLSFVKILLVFVVLTLCRLLFCLFCSVEYKCFIPAQILSLHEF